MTKTLLILSCLLIPIILCQRLLPQQITAGSGHFHFLDNHGKIYSWGSNSLGDGTTINRPSFIFTPLDMSGVLNGKNITQISAGDAHTIAMDSEGKLYSWGKNGQGQLGDAKNRNSYKPVAVEMSGVLSGKKIVKFSAGSHVLAIDSTGAMYSWGANGNGQVGDGTITNRNTPVAVDTSGPLNGKQIVQFAAGYAHSLAMDSNGVMFSWGCNGNGELGDGTLIDRHKPVVVDMIGVLYGKKIIQISAGLHHSLVLDSNGLMYSWGSGGNGELGDGSTIMRTRAVSVDMKDVSKMIVKIAAGSNYNLAIDDSGMMYSWGENTCGQLGDGTTDNRNRPVAVETTGVLNKKKITHVAAGTTIGYAMDSNSFLYYWGCLESIKTVPAEMKILMPGFSITLFAILVILIIFGITQLVLIIYHMLMY